MKKLIVVMMVMGMLAGCAGSRAYSEMMEQHGSLRVGVSDFPSADYRFYIKAGRDIGMNTQEKGDRLKLMQGYLGEECKSVSILHEIFLPSGGSAIGGLKLGTYVEDVKCLKNS